jgi:hypothetical protein
MACWSAAIVLKGTLGIMDFDQVVRGSSSLCRTRDQDRDSVPGEVNLQDCRLTRSSD